MLIHFHYTMLNMFSFNKLMRFAVFSVFIISTVAKVKLPANVSVSAVIVFGDSIVDPGNNNNRLLSIAKSNYAPYGRDFMGGISTGRFSNGRVPSDMLAEELGVKSLVPAFLDPNLNPNDLLTGVNFASGGAGYDPLTSQIQTAISVDRQLGLFKEYIKKLTKLVGEKKTKSILSNAVYMIVLGTNDIASYFGPNPVKQIQYDVDSYTTLIVDYGTTFLKQIYALGARRVVVFSSPPLGCLPSQRTADGGLLRDCSDKMNDASKLFNSKLYTSISSLTESLPNARFVYTDIYNTLLDLIQNYPKYGFEVATRGCCGTGLIEATPICNPSTLHNCPDASKYIFWDTYHPTERAYELVTHMYLPETISGLF